MVSGDLYFRLEQRKYSVFYSFDVKTYILYSRRFAPWQLTWFLSRPHGTILRSPDS